MLAAGPLTLRPRGAALALAALTGLAGLALWPGEPQARREAAPAGSVALCGFGETCRTVGCHFSYPFGSPTLSWELRQSVPDAPLPSHWVPGRPLDLKLVAQDSEAWFLGFQLAAALDCPFALNGGTLELLEPMRTTIVTDDFELDYLTHSCSCLDLYDCCGFVPEIPGSGDYSWSFRWTPPPRGSGPVTFHVALNTANGDGTPDFDRISIGQVVLDEEPCPPLIDDLRVRKSNCDPSSPGDPRIELLREGGGALDVIRETEGWVGLEAGLPVQWSEVDSCRPLLDGRSLVAWSVAPSCDLGGEGWH